MLMIAMLAIAPAALAAGPLSGPPNADGLRWQFEPGSGGIPSGHLIYGIPQSDAVQMTARCMPSRPTVAVELAAPVEGLTPGGKVQVVFNVPGRESVPPGRFIEGFQGSLGGTVVAPKGGEGLTGFRVEVPIGDGLWAALRGGGTLRYGRTATNALTLAGARPVVDAFLAHCRSLASAAPLPRTTAS